MIRSATPADAEKLLGIYSYYVENTAISFECSVPSSGEFRSRIENTLLRFPYLVAEDENGVIAGYAYAGPFKTRDAYNISCEVSIYIDKDKRGMGYGRKLYEVMERELRNRGILNMYACIATPDGEDEYLTDKSEKFHAHMGFSFVGKFRKCASKFGRRYDMIWMEKNLEK